MNLSKINKSVLVAIAASIVIAGIGYAVATTFLLKFKSDGILTIDMSGAEYKRFTEAVSSLPNLKQVFASIPPENEEDKSAIEKMLGLGVQKWHTPLPVLSKLDTKDLPEALIKIELERNTDKNAEKTKQLYIFVGARITATSPDAVQAARMALWLGNYFKEIAAKEAMRDQLFIWLAENRQFNERAQEDRLKHTFEIEQAQTRATSLKKVLAQYPDLAKSEARQVVDVRKDNERFISPGAQLVGAETQIIDIREKIAKLDRSIVQQLFAQSYFAEAEKVLNTANTGSGLILVFSDLTKKYSAKVQNEAEKEKLLSIAATVSEISARFLSQAQFVLPPTVPSRAETPRPLMVASIFGALGFLLSLGWFFRQWIWRKVTEPETDLA
jgi:hypothetical protein